MDMPVNVPVDDPNADTEWNDILRKHGIIPEKPPSPTPIIEEAILDARRREHENRLEDKDLDELAELEDEEDEEFLEIYRKKRLEELSRLQRTSIHNQVYPLQKPDYSREVTEASSQYFVLVNLTSMNTNVESWILSDIWRQLAEKYGDIKFCEMRANMCIEGYPEKNTPTILIYKDGDIKKQIVTLGELNGPKTRVEDIEQVLVSLGALNENDSRLKKRSATPKDASSDEEYLDDWD
ncbi:Proteolipid protein 2 [Emydomyces testavorans]|uniref:Proteolipid protein 2 n=1 Tax=Emydomyces testavorans TaxID=2070801 RepID=A0AAF0DKZ8_9EURO|nr:Proteolipid protein 2 [Emydomyces testavorans]